MILLKILTILKQKAFRLGCRLRAIVVVKKIGESLGLKMFPNISGELRSFDIGGFEGGAGAFYNTKIIGQYGNNGYGTDGHDYLAYFSAFNSNEIYNSNTVQPSALRILSVVRT